MNYFQTGDVLYKQTKELPEGLKAVPGNLIHQGYNHHHTIEGDFELMQGEGDSYIVAKGACKLLHPEHKTVEIPSGIYKKEIVKEYDHWDEESRNVID